MILIYTQVLEINGVEIYLSDLNVPEKRFRPEIEGLRTIATLLIAIYHIWLGKVSGGVDIFFVLSGFLITMSLLSRLEKTGKLQFWDHILRLLKRLFPLAFTVIIFTTFLSFIFLPKVQWEQVISHMFASTFYFENWRLSLDSVDYLAKDYAASPFQHFWSMSVQGQFYLIWPCILFIAYLLAQKFFKTPVRKTLLVVLSICFILSISYSIYMTAANQPWAYFDTFARLWEFCLGGIFALVLPYLHLNNWFSTIIGWLGLLIVCLTGVLIPVSKLFPGYIALLPIVSALLIILASEKQSRFGVNRLLSLKPFLVFGHFTYGFYLWHWPLLIFYKTYFDIATVSITAGIIILFVTFILSFTSTKLIEAPIRKIDLQQSKKKLVSVIFGMLIAIVLTNVMFHNFTEQSSIQLDENKIENYPGALVFYENREAPKGIEYIPSLVTVKEDLPSFYDEKSCFTNSETITKCSFGATENPDYTIALVGGSHSGHWFPPLEQLAHELNFQIDVFIHDGCRFTNDDFRGQMTPECLIWNENLIDILKENPPDLVFTTSTVHRYNFVPKGYIGQWKQLEGVTQIFAVRDNPRMPMDIPTCLENENDPSRCSISRKIALSEVLPWENTEGIPSNVTFADLSDNFCDENRCYGVIGNIIVYRDQHHITAEFAKTLAPALRKPLAEALENLD